MTAHIFAEYNTRRAAAMPRLDVFQDRPKTSTLCYFNGPVLGVPDKKKPLFDAIKIKRQ